MLHSLCCVMFGQQHEKLKVSPIICSFTLPPHMSLEGVQECKRFFKHMNLHIVSQIYNIFFTQNVLQASGEEGGKIFLIEIPIIITKRMLGQSIQR